MLKLVDGWARFPLQPNTKEPWPGSHGCKDARTDYPIPSGNNVGYATGTASGFFVVDIDCKDIDGFKSLDEWQNKNVNLPLTYRVQTPSGGIHLYFRMPPGVDLRNRGAWLPGVDVRGNGGYVVGAGSELPNGAYTVVCEELIADAPPELVTSIIKSPCLNKKQAGMNGNRNNTIYIACARMRHRNMTYEDAKNEATKINDQFPEPLEAWEVNKCLNNAWKDDPKELDNTLNDSGFAQRFASMHDGRLYFIAETGTWLKWHNEWVKIDENMALCMNECVYKLLFEQAADAFASSEDRGKALIKAAQRAASSNGRKAILALCKGDLTMHVNDLDAKDNLVGAINGVIDLDTGEFRRYQPEDFITKRIGCEYNKSAVCPRWTQFLAETFNGDAEMIGFIQRALGYSLTASTSEHQLFFLYGFGANGKSVFLNTINRLFSDYSAVAGAETILRKDREASATNDLARLVGKRLVIANELNEGKHMDEAKVKTMTGGDNITARFLYHEDFTFKPQFKMWIAGNHKPVISGNDDGIWRRICLIPFENKVSPEAQDIHLEVKLAEELPGILNWIIDGLNQYKVNRLAMPDKARLATQSYREEMDVIGDWIKDCCEIQQFLEFKAGKLYDSYSQYILDNGGKPLSNVKFAQKMTERGYKRERKSEGQFYIGIAAVRRHW